MALRDLVLGMMVATGMMAGCSTDSAAEEELALTEAEMVEASGPLLATYEPAKRVDYEVVLHSEQDIQVIVNMMEQAERKEGPVTDIGPMLTLVFVAGESSAGPYDFFFNDTIGSFEAPEDSDGRFYLQGDGMEKIKEIIYKALEEQTGLKAGVSAFAAPSEISPAMPILSVTLVNDRAEAFAAQEVGIERKNDEMTWVPFPDQESAWPAEDFSCPAYETCQVEMGLQEISGEWPPGEYRIAADSLTVPFTVSGAGE
ncbi:hypothetical protein [Indiicoccus explosivorum]|uniref:hypothetical protein n=1 Tax=Indiicoccus explosivorum TaxID=1917864 RepID=UPI000B44DFD2|nr:hypothetical protein [Indiicoccus explosivorum]